MTDFQPIFDWVISWEGKVLENVLGDRGGLTFWGISRNANSNWSGWVLVDQYMKAAGGDIHQASFLANQDTALIALAERFYQNLFNEWNLAPLNYQELGLQIFDKSVNMGPSMPMKIVQVLVGVYADGVYGPQTIQAINNHPNPSQLVDQFLNWAQAHYTELVAKDPEDAKFYAGWENRCHRSDQSGPSH